MRMASERFWGHASVEFPNMPDKKWWPISVGEASRLQKVLSSGRRLCGWLAVETLNNRLLLINPMQWQRFLLLDDAAEGPEGDFACKGGLDDYAGMPADLYRRLAEWADGDGEFEHNNSVAKKEALAAVEQSGFLARREELRAFLRHTVIHYVGGKMVSYEANRADLHEVIEIEGDADAGTVEISTSDGNEHYYNLDKLSMIEVPMIELETARAELEDEY